MQQIADGLGAGRFTTGAEHRSRVIAALREAYARGYAAGRSSRRDHPRVLRRESLPSSAKANTRAPGAREPRFAIYALGKLRVARDRYELELVDRRRSRSLLALLTVNTGSRLSLDAIAEALWPDASLDAAANRLTIALHYLRRQLGLAASEGPIVRDRSTLALELSHDCWLDTAELQAAATSGDLATKHDALELYRGDLLEDVSWEEWVLRPRDDAREDALRIVRQLADAAGASGDLDAVAAHLRRGLTIDPADEDLRRRLVEVEKSRGRLVAARRYLAEPAVRRPRP